MLSCMLWRISDSWRLPCWRFPDAAVLDHTMIIESGYRIPMSTLKMALVSIRLTEAHLYLQLRDRDLEEK